MAACYDVVPGVPEEQNRTRAHSDGRCSSFHSGSSVNYSIVRHLQDHRTHDCSPHAGGHSGHRRHDSWVASAAINADKLPFLITIWSLTFGLRRRRLTLELLPEEVQICRN